MRPADYRPYRDLPPLAGIATFEQAMRPGLSVDECVRRIKRYHYALRRLHQIFISRIPAEPVYELKMAFGLHAYICAEHVAAFAARVGEMREPPLGLEDVPDERLAIFFDEILAAPTTEELICGLYARAVPAVRRALERHLAETNPLADHPTVRLCRFALLEIGDMERFGAEAVARLVDGAARERMGDWLGLLDACLAAAGGLDGAGGAEGLRGGQGAERADGPEVPRRPAGVAVAPGAQGPARADGLAESAGPVSDGGVAESRGPAGAAAGAAARAAGAATEAPEAVGSSPEAAGGVAASGASERQGPPEKRREAGEGAGASARAAGPTEAADPVSEGGVAEACGPAGAAIARRYSARPYVFDGVPRRDERFPDPYNMGVNAEAFLYNGRYPAKAKTLMLYYKRLREIDVPEVMAAILAETPGKDWAYYRDMTRQLWDEARHAMMGEVGFVRLGIDWPRTVRINHTWSLGLNTQLGALDRHAVLYFIEQGLMARTGKRFEWEVATESGDPLCRLFQDYDWADEVLHARIGRDWYVREIGDFRRAMENGDRCWSRVFMNWKLWREQGLTQHENWWPQLYREACARWDQAPEPEVLAFHESYEDKRADLRSVSG